MLNLLAVASMLAVILIPCGAALALSLLPVHRTNVRDRIKRSPRYHAGRRIN